MKHVEKLFPMVFVVALLFGGAVAARAQSEITLLAPSPTRKPIDRILQNYQSKTGKKVKVTYSGARTTTQSVAKGEALDVSLVVAPVTGPLTSGAVIPDSMTLVASYQTAVIVLALRKLNRKRAQFVRDISSGGLSPTLPCMGPSRQLLGIAGQNASDEASRFLKGDGAYQARSLPTSRPVNSKGWSRSLCVHRPRSQGESQVASLRQIADSRSCR